MVHDRSFAAHGTAERLVERHVDGAIASSDCQRLRGGRSVLRWLGESCESAISSFRAGMRTWLSADAAWPMRRAETTGAICTSLTRMLHRPIRAVRRRPRGHGPLLRHLGPHLNLVQAWRASYAPHLWRVTALAVTACTVIEAFVRCCFDSKATIKGKQARGEQIINRLNRLNRLNRFR